MSSIPNSQKAKARSQKPEASSHQPEASSCSIKDNHINSRTRPMETNNDRDPKLWRIAKKRAGFKAHLATYLTVNIFLWALWYLTAYGKGLEYSIMPWPA